MDTSKWNIKKYEETGNIGYVAALWLTNVEATCDATRNISAATEKQFCKQARYRCNTIAGSCTNTFNTDARKHNTADIKPAEFSLRTAAHHVNLSVAPFSASIAHIKIYRK